MNKELKPDRSASDLAAFVHRGAAMMTPRVLKSVHKKLPFLKLKFTEMDGPTFPHLVDQLEFLAAVVEDFAEGADDDLPYSTVAAAAFVLIYAHRAFDLIPDAMPEAIHADESVVVRTILTEHKKALETYANRHEMKWESISLQP